MREQSPGDLWGEIVRTAQLVRGYRHPAGLPSRIHDRQPLTDADERYVVGLTSDAVILAGLVEQLAARRGPLAEVHYDPDATQITGISEIDRALEYLDPVPMLIEYFAARWEHDGQDAVVADLERSVARLPPDSPAHDGVSAWLVAAREGVRPQ
jgi:hypothetical protein